MALPIFQRTVTNSAGDIIVGAEISVFDESTGLAATIFSNRDGTTPLTNPFFTGVDGLAQFYAQQGEYRITASSAAGSVTWRYEPLIGTLDEGAAVLQAGIYAQNASASAATAIGASNWEGIWSDGGAGVAGTSYTHDGSVWLLQVALADILTSEPAQTNTDWLRINADPMFYYAVSQLAGGDASIVTMIDPNVDASLYAYFVYRPTGQIFTGSVTGTFSSPLDFDPATGIDSGLSGALVEVPALTKLQSVIAFVVSQYAGGDASIVTPISAGLPLADYDWFVDTNTLQVFAKNGATGTFSDPLDFDPVTGTDSGITGVLVKVDAITETRVSGIESDISLLEFQSNKSITINFASDANLTLTSDQNKYGRVELTDSGVLLTVSREVIVDTSERNIIVINKTLQDLTVKTLSGSGTLVLSGATASLFNNSVDVIKNIMPVGVNQRLTDVTLSRSVGVVETNNTGQTIEVTLEFSSSSSNLNVNFEVNGYSVIGSAGTYNDQIYTITIPALATYELVSTTMTLQKWSELA